MLRVDSFVDLCQAMPSLDASATQHRTAKRLRAVALLRIILGCFATYRIYTEVSAAWWFSKLVLAIECCLYLTLTAVDPATNDPAWLSATAGSGEILGRQVCFFLRSLSGQLHSAKAMSLRRLSPTANLLRTSRLFALPPQLERPNTDLTATSIQYSDTSTTPYPTHAAIHTTESSLARGDWGLKRALPLKSTTRTSTPTIYIDNVDSIDHITDFGSAADHVITLRKWQELDMALSRGNVAKKASTQLSPATSVFDSQYDNTQVDERSLGGRSKQRWKYRGPWIAGKSDGEFNQYLAKSLKRRKLDFRRFLGAKLAPIKAAQRRREATERGEDLAELEPISEHELDAYIKRLRNDENAMHKAVEEFLDLPRDASQAVGGVESGYDVKGPPTTHPSAGLSYIRTESHMSNHPEFGPQESKTPFGGRVVAPQKIRGINQRQALIGIGGVVAGDHRYTFFKEEPLAGVGQYDPDIEGGAKLWVHPKRATVDARGRIELVVDRADKNAINVATGLHSEEESLQPPPAAVAGARNREIPNLTARIPRSSQGYGLENLDEGNRAGRAEPFLGPFLGPNDGQPDVNLLLKVVMRK